MVRSNKDGTADKVLVPPDAKAALIVAVHRCGSHDGQNRTFLVPPLDILHPQEVVSSYNFGKLDNS